MTTTTNFIMGQFCNRS